MPEDSLTGYRFVITLDPGDAHLPRPQADQIPRIAAGAFSEVTGLSGELEITNVNGYATPAATTANIPMTNGQPNAAYFQLFGLRTAPRAQ